MTRSNVSPIRSDYLKVETHLMNVVGSLSALRALGLAASSNDLEGFTGDDFHSLISLIEDEAKRALEAHMVR